MENTFFVTIDRDKLLRKIYENDMTLEEFAAGAGVDGETVKSWLDEEGFPTPDEAETIMDVYDWPLTSYYKVIYIKTL